MISKDAQFAYLKEKDSNTWKKLRVVDQSLVGELIVTPPVKVHKHTAYTGSNTTVHYPLPVTPTAPIFDLGGVTANFCKHDGTVSVWQAEERDFYCAGMGGIRPANYALVLDLADQVGPHRKAYWTDDLILVPSPAKFMDLNRLRVQKGVEVGKDWTLPESYKNVVHFRWTDGKVIKAGTAFWEELWAALPKGKILIACLGSHGRTGTCLAALMMASGTVESPLQAILTVRSKHCEMAIESYAQLHYLDQLAAEWGYPQDATDAQKIPMGKSGERLTTLLAKAARKG